MVTNLPPEVRALEYQYLNAKTLDEKIKILEEIIAKTPKHKGTEKYLSQIKKRLKKLKQEKERLEKQKRKSYVVIPKDTELRISIIGVSFSGKTKLLEVLCGNYSQYYFFNVSTLKLYEIPIQTIECPPYLTSEVLQVLASSDLIIIIIDLTQDIDYQFKELIDEILEKFKNRKILIVATKADEKGTKLRYEKLLELLKNKNLNLKVCPVSIKFLESIEKLKEEIYKELEIIRIYTKEPGKPPSRKPLILKKGATIKDVAEHIHKDFIKRFKYAKVWGKSVKFQGQTVGLEHQLEDGDIVEIHLR